MTDPRQYAAATLRNRDAILKVLRARLPATGTVVEVASGSGEHAVHFAAALPAWVFQPSDPDPARRASIDAWAQASGLGNIRPAIDLDATAGWPVLEADAVLCCNMIHIAPWQAARGLIQGAAQLLATDGLLILYGPFKRGFAHTAESNAAFDRDLRQRDPAWGLRDLEAVEREATANGFGAAEVLAMPANNLTIVFRR